MKQLFTQLLCVGTLAAIGAGSSYADNIQGYFRVQNAAQTQADAGYVQVRGAFTAQPDQSFDRAATQAGTIMYLNAAPEKQGSKTVYRIDNLRCQGIEVVGEIEQDYIGAMRDIIENAGSLDSKQEALWALVRAGFEKGYTSVGRSLIQSMIWIVAARLDEEGLSEAEELANFADRFNHEVAEKINLSIYLEPAEYGYRLFYDVPDLQCVSDWYLKDENKATFEKGFAAMRQFLGERLNGNTGERLDPSEIAEMQAWGYDPTAKHTQYDDQGLLVTTYEDIFADHELLFNWLKLNMIKFTDEDRCPQISLKGFYLPDFAVEMKKHALTAQLISYFPRLQTNERVYLTDGKNGVLGHLDFTSAEGALALDDYSQWVLRPVTAEDDSYFCVPAVGAPDHYGYCYSTGYFDFPVQAVDPESTKLYALSAEYKQVEIFCQPVHYYELEEHPELVVPARTPMLIEMTTEDAHANHRLVPVYDLSLPEVEPEGLAVTDEIASAGQRVQRKAGSQTMPAFHGVLLATEVSESGFANQWDQAYDASTPVHVLTVKSVGQLPTAWYEAQSTGSTVAANQAILVNAANANSGYAVKEPKENPMSGINSVEAAGAETAPAVYDLEGRRVESMTPGKVYILNGKKILAI